MVWSCYRGFFFETFMRVGVFDPLITIVFFRKCIRGSYLEKWVKTLQTLWCILSVITLFPKRIHVYDHRTFLRILHAFWSILLPVYHRLVRKLRRTECSQKIVHNPLSAFVYIYHHFQKDNLAMGFVCPEPLSDNATDHMFYSTMCRCRKYKISSVPILFEHGNANSNS